jgi:transposase
MHDEATRTAVLRLARREPPLSKRAIARAVGISRESVQAILDSGQATATHPERKSALDEHIERVRDLHRICGRNLVRVHEKLAEEGVDVPYATLTAFCRRHGIGHKPKERAGQYHFEPGEEMQHDTSPHRVEIGGRPRLVQCASLVLCYSQRIAAQVYPRFTRFYAKAFLTEAIPWLGGAAGRCVIDNSSVIISHGTGKNAVPAPEMAAFAERFGFVWMAHELGDANRSARVERPFDYIERNFYPGRTFADFDDLNAQLREWCRKVDEKEKRRLQTSPIALYATEQSALKPLPIYIPEVYELVRRTVDLEGYVHFATNRYSAPDTMIGREVEVRVSLSTVRIVDRHQVVAEHARVEDGLHAARTLPEHRKKRRSPAGSAPPIAEEGPLRAAAPELSALVDALKRHHGGRAVRAIRKLHRMFTEFPTEALVAGVRRALEYGLVDLDRVEKLVLRQISGNFFRQPQEADDG